MSEVKQGSDEWKRMRLGKITASRFKDMMTNGRAKGAGGMGKTAHTYMMDKVAEILTNRPQDEIKAWALEWGNQNEAQARQMYCLFRDCVVHEVPFIPHPDFPEWVGASPDALVGEDGGLELKCPERSRIHLTYIQEGKLPADYYWQVHGHLWVTGRKWWDFASFDPRMTDPNLMLFVHRVYADQEVLDELSERAARFIEQLEIKLFKIRSKGIEFNTPDEE